MNLTEAADYFEMTVDQRNADGQCGYGICLHNGCGIFIDLKGAAYDFKLASNQQISDPSYFESDRNKFNPSRNPSTNIAQSSVAWLSENGRPALSIWQKQLACRTDRRVSVL
jgi:TPR repeat protein